MSGCFSFLDNHAGAIQAFTAVVVAGLTFWLIMTTRKYVRITNDSLNLAREQFTESTRVEVFLKLRTVMQTSTAFDAFIDFANLSGRGIWWEGYSVIVTAKEKDTTGKTIRKKVQKIVPAYDLESVDCATAFNQAYQTTGLGREKPVVSVKVEATYRVGGKILTAQFEVPEIILLGRHVFLVTEDEPPDDF